MKSKLLCLLLLLVLVAPHVSAVGFKGMPPPDDREFFYRGEKIEIPLTVVGEKGITVTASTKQPQNPETLGTDMDDNIMEYITIEDPDPNGDAREVNVIVDLPDSMKPGLYRVDIYAKDAINQAGSVVAVATTKLQFRFWVLSPEPLLDIGYFRIPSIAEGLDAEASILINSRSQVDVNGVYAEITVYAGDEELKSQSRTLLLESATSEVITENLNTDNLKGGDYDARAIVHYAGKTAEAKTILKVGTLHVDIPSYTKELDYNATNLFKFNISNQWNRELQKVYAIVQFKDQEKQTASLNIAPFGLEEYEIYFDRDESVLPGPVDVNITVIFQDFNVESESYVDKIESFVVTPSILIPVEVEDPFDVKFIVLLSVVCLLLLILAVVLILLLRGKHEEKKEE